MCHQTSLPCSNGNISSHHAKEKECYSSSTLGLWDSFRFGSQRPGSMWWLTPVLTSLGKRSDHRLALKGLHERPHQRPQEASQEPEASSYTQNKACLPKIESALRVLDMLAPIWTSRNQSGHHQPFPPENVALLRRRQHWNSFSFLPKYWASDSFSDARGKRHGQFKIMNKPKLIYILGFPCGSDGKEPACNSEDPGSIPGEENGHPLQSSCLENSINLYLCSWDCQDKHTNMQTPAHPWTNMSAHTLRHQHKHLLLYNLNLIL